MEQAAVIPETNLSGVDSEPLSRRRALLEIAGVVIGLGIPAGAMIATAQPIPNPPDRDVLMALSPARQALIEQRRAVEHDHKRAAKKATRKKKSPSRDRRARQRQREQGKQARRAQQRARAERRAAQP